MTVSTTENAQITAILTTLLNRAPTADEVTNAANDPQIKALVHDNLDVGLNHLTVSPEDDLATAISNLSSDGGGTLNLLAGDYVLTADLSIPGNIQLIGAGPSLTSIIGVLGHVVKCHGSSGTHNTDVVISGIGFYSGSSAAMLDFQYVDRVTIGNVVLSGNVNGLLLDNCTDLDLSTIVAVSNSGYGITISNSSNIDARSIATSGNGGVGLVLSSVSTFSFLACDSAGNIGAGITQNSCSAGNMTITSSGNGSDGVTMTGSSCKFISCTLAGNAAYGINVSDSGSVNNIILGSEFASNTSGAVHDSGTGTLIRSNIGVSDN